MARELIGAEKSEPTAAGAVPAAPDPWDLSAVATKSRLITPGELADRLGVSVSAVVTGTVCLIAAALGRLVGDAVAARPRAGGHTAYSGSGFRTCGATRCQH